MEEKDLTPPKQENFGEQSDHATTPTATEEAVLADAPEQVEADPGPEIARADIPESIEGEMPVVEEVPEQEVAPEADAAFVPAETPDPEPAPVESTIDEILQGQLAIETAQREEDTEESRQLAILEAVVYVTDEPLSAEQIARALDRPLPEVKILLDKLVADYNRPEHGLTVKEVAGGYKMATKPEHHEAVRTFVKNLNPPLKLSLAALETLAVIAYKQPITAPEIMEIRGVQGAGVLKTLLDRKLITTAGRKNVVGKPILYKTTKEFLVQFGLRDLSELPTLKEFEDLRRMAFSDVEEVPVQSEPERESAAAAPESAAPPDEPEPENNA